MAKPLFKPTKKQLMTAWVWKRKRKTRAVIAKKLKIPLTQYDRAKPYFNAYFEQIGKKEKHEAQKMALTYKRSVDDILLEKKKGQNKKAGNPKIEITDIDLEQLKSFVLVGFNRERIASLLGISRTTLYTYAKQFPHIQDVLDNAEARATTGVVGSMLRMTDDRTVEDEVYTAHEGVITTKKIQKHVAPSAAMIKYWMVNKERWGGEPGKETEDHKGSIMKYLDEIAGDDPNQGDQK